MFFKWKNSIINTNQIADTHRYDLRVVKALLHLRDSGIPEDDKKKIAEFGDMPRTTRAEPQHLVLQHISDHDGKQRNQHFRGCR